MTVNLNQTLFILYNFKLGSFCVRKHKNVYFLFLIINSLLDILKLINNHIFMSLFRKKTFLISIKTFILFKNIAILIF